MNLLSAIVPKGVTGRADLLRLLATAPRDRLALDDDASSWFGYVRRTKGRQIELKAHVEFSVSARAKGEVTRQRQGPVQLPFLHALVHREARPQLETDIPAPSAWEQAAPLTEDDTRSLSFERLIDFEDLVPQARLMPALRRLLGADRPGPLDLDRLTRQVASCRIPRYLPRRTYPRWHPDLVVVLDFSSRLWPYRWDMHQLARRLLRLVGRTGVSLRLVERGPLGPWSDWRAHQNRTSPLDPPERPWAMPLPGTPVLLVSDLGMLLGRESATAATWAAFVEDLSRAQLRPVALVPLGAAQLGAPVPSRLPVLRWSPDARPHAVPVRGEAVEEPDGLEDLLAMIAATRRVDPPLLRALRRLTPRASQNAGLEGAAWCHTDVEAIHTASIGPDARETHLRRFAQLSPASQAKADELRSMHHCHLRALINHEEQLWWEGHAHEAAVALSPSARKRGTKARAFFRQMAKTVVSADPQTAAHWRSIAEGVVWRADAAMADRSDGALYAVEASLKSAEGETRRSPDWVDPQKLAAAMGRELAATSHWLVRDAASACLVLQAEPPRTRQSPLVDDLAVDDGGVRITTEANGSRRPVTGAILPALDPHDTVMLETSSEFLLIAAVERPLGALSWGCGREGIFVQSPPFGSWERRWRGDALRPVPHLDEHNRWALEAKTGNRWLATEGSPSPNVFISYSIGFSQDAPEHDKRVLALVDRLNADGVSAWTLDFDPWPPPASWPMIELESVVEADFVLMICTSAYCRLLETEEEVGGARDVLWEKPFLVDLLHDADASDRFVPVLFSDASPEQIPTPLKGRAHYVVDTASGYENLLRRLKERLHAFSSGQGGVRFGIDAPYGIYAELTIATEHGRASQRLRWMPPGTFLMGSPEDEPGRDRDEGPQHEVTITNGFWLFDTPCTQALWEAVMGENPSRFKSPDRPVENVSWGDAQAFLERINALVPGLDLVLPSEAQWEYGCRAGTETAIYTGDIEIVGKRDAPALDPIAWYGGNSGVDFGLEDGSDSSGWPEKQHPHSRAGTHPVARKQPNAWGLYDMLGNVWEWCADHWHDRYDGAPSDGSAWIDEGADAGEFRVLRGGSWSGNARIVRSAYRLHVVPGGRYRDNGFRCARVQEGREPGEGPEARKEKKQRSKRAAGGGGAAAA